MPEPFEAALVELYVRRPAAETEQEHLAAMAAAIGETAGRRALKPSPSVTTVAALRERVGRPSRTARLGRVATVAGAAALAVPLSMAGLATAGVSLPGPAQSAFETVGIELPNQTKDGSEAGAEPAHVEECASQTKRDGAFGKCVAESASSFGECVADLAGAGAGNPAKACAELHPARAGVSGGKGAKGKGHGKGGNATGKGKGKGGGSKSGAGKREERNPTGGVVRPPAQPGSDFGPGVAGNAQQNRPAAPGAGYAPAAPPGTSGSPPGRSSGAGAPRAPARGARGPTGRSSGTSAPPVAAGPKK